MPVYINIHIFLYVNINICIIIYTLHKHTVKVVFLLKFFSVSPPSTGKYPSSSARIGPAPLVISFCQFHVLFFFWALVHHWKWRYHTLAFHLTASIHRHKSRTGTKLQRHLSCLLLFPKVRAEGKEKGVLWMVMPEFFSAPFSPLHPYPVYKSHIIACLLCAVHGKGSKVNFFSYLMHFADTHTGLLSIITSLDAKTEGKMKAWRKYLVTRAN